LLYYVTPDWKLEYGGNLEMWPNGIAEKQTTIHSKFNRLVVMVTHDSSWHSVSKIKQDAHRCCISNYYFSETSIHKNEKFHVTSFRGRPEQKNSGHSFTSRCCAENGNQKNYSKRGGKNRSHLYKINGNITKRFTGKNNYPDYVKIRKGRLKFF